MTDPSAPPSVSLIIPTYQRAERLAETLRAVAAQTLPAAALEVIVVDDGAAEATRQVVQYGPLPSAQYVPQTHGGATQARNVGARQARGHLLVFMDDDIELGPASLALLVAAQQAHPGGVVIGTLLDPGAPLPAHTGVVSAPFSKCYTGLLSVAAADFAALEGFRDVTGLWPNWDDVEFGYRVHLAGLPIRRCWDAWAIHHDATQLSFGVSTRRSMAAAQAAARLFRVHPGIRAHLPMLDDKGPVDWRADGPRLIMRKLVRRVASTWPVLRLLEWLEQRTAPGSRKATLRRWINGGYLWHGYRRGLREL